MKRVSLIIVSCIMVIILVLSVMIGAFAMYVSSSIDYDRDDKLFAASKSSNTTEYYAYDAEGNLIRVYKDAAGAAKTWVNLADVASVLIDAFISAEDRSFYTHSGVNVKRSLAAMLNCVFHFTSGFGGSTITQQVIKNISGDNEHTLRRKISEMMRSVHLDMTHTKEDVLEMYINVIPMSGNLYGVSEACFAYFNKSPADLTLTEAATLVGIANAPGRYDPVKHPEACLKKRNIVLYAMMDNKKISQEEYDRAVTLPLGIDNVNRSVTPVMSWFIETARETIIADLSAKYNTSRSGAIMMLGGAKVLLTMNPEVQALLDEYFENRDNFPIETQSGLRYAMVICDSCSGDIIGIRGADGKKTGNRVFNYAAALHPPASTIKPLSIYAPMIDDGELSWSTLIEDSPREFRRGENSSASYPKNSPDIYEGRITVCDAIKKSKNTVAYELYLSRGGDRIFKDLQNKFGFTGLVSSQKAGNTDIGDISASALAFGQFSKGLSLLELTHAYTVFPSYGVLRGGRSYYGVFDADGDVLIDNRVNERRIFKRGTCEIMNKLLSEVAESGTAKSITLKESLDTAAKTGTSSGNRDKLLVGYTPYYTAAIWCGYENGNIGVYSCAPNHLEIWDDVMSIIHSKTLPKLDDGVKTLFEMRETASAVYCRSSGDLATPGCFESGCAERGYFSNLSQPKRACRIHSE